MVKKKTRPVITDRFVINPDTGDKIPTFAFKAKGLTLRESERKILSRARRKFKLLKKKYSHIK